MKMYSILLFSFIFYANKLLIASAGTLDAEYGPNNNGTSVVRIGRQNVLDKIARTTNDYVFGIGTVTVIQPATGLCLFTPSGSLDESFNGIGYTRLNIGSKIYLNALAVQENGYALVGGQTIINGIPECFIARYSPTGTLDTTFGQNGYFTENISDGSMFNVIVLQSDGKIIGAGTAGQGNPGFLLARYMSDGSVDTDFGNQGKVQINPGYISTITAAELQSDGKIVVAGFSWDSNRDSFTVARFNSNGSIDESFGNQGIAITSIGFSSQATSIAIQDDGKIVVGGYTTEDQIYYLFALARYDTTGTLDSTFNQTGIVTTEIDFSARIHSLLIQPDSKIVAGGSNFGYKDTTFTLARYTSTGILDSTFGTNGLTFTPIGLTAQINGLCLQSDGKLIAAGFSDNSAALARYFL